MVQKASNQKTFNFKRFGKISLGLVSFNKLAHPELNRNPLHHCIQNPYLS